MALACEALGLPVVSGNVSLYNEHHGRPIHPTPVVGVVGVLDDASLAVGAAFRAEGDVVLVVGDGPAAIDGSAYQRVVDGTTEGRIPEPDLAAERRLHELLATAAERRLLESAHDVSTGGVAVAIAESAILGAIGVDAPDPGDPFTEGDGRAVVSARPEHVTALEELAGDLALRRVGTVGGERIVVAGATIDVGEATALYEGAIPRALGEAEETA
jgi:phosphoribosylformylglycinamidine synthase